MRKNLFRTIVVFVVIIAPLFARDREFHILSRRREIFENKDCAKNQSCSLKNATFTKEDYKIGEQDEYNYGTRLTVHYQTDSPQTLKDYAVVQIIKGCKFSTRLVNNTTVFYQYQDTMHFGVQKQLRFVDWVLDSFDTDPVLTAVPKHSRYYYARRNSSTEFGKQGFLRDSKKLPKSPDLYVIDHAGNTAYLDAHYGIAYNVSLKLITCIYKVGDVPTTTTPDNINFATPITCFAWAESWIYGFEKNEFEDPFEIAPACK